MDNQQATSWFVGILEGEGSFSKTQKSGTRVRISNTELDLIESCEKVLKNLGILFTRSSWQRSSRKREYEIIISTQSMCTRLYEQLGEKIQGRHKELERIIGASETTRDGSSDLWWLIGFMEAEGSFHISRRMSRGDVDNYSPEITVANTRFQLIEKAVITLHATGMSWHVRHYKPEIHSEYKTITIRGYCRVQRFLRVTQDLWQSSRVRKKASLILEFVDSRLVMNVKEPYTKRQHEIFHVLRNMI